MPGKSLGESGAKAAIWGTAFEAGELQSPLGSLLMMWAIVRRTKLKCNRQGKEVLLAWSARHLERKPSWEGQ